ncbi:MAG: ABC transporter ATP-binding protein [Ignavibacteria bacterium]|nr:ABC transporter ATP-binding protein [Ignavibacteria bacterium]
MIITADNIHKSYNTGKQEVRVLKGVSLQIPRAKVSVIVGASGAGKSTLLHILSGLDKPDSGLIRVNDTTISAMNDKQLSNFRSKVTGFVFQFHHLLPEFSALENVAIPLMIGGVHKKNALKRAAELLDIVELSHRESHRPSELSGGEQQRVAIARALANDPLIIFADEPTGNLDSGNSEAIHHLFLELRDKLQKTFVIVTHNPSLMQLADHIFEIQDGAILLEKNQELVPHPAS